MKRVVLILLVFALLFTVSTPAFARGGYHHGGDATIPCLLAGLGGLFFLGAAASQQQPVVVAPVPQCVRVIPGYWGAQWNPYIGGYVRFFIPPREILVPCP